MDSSIRESRMNTCCVERSSTSQLRRGSGSVTKMVVETNTTFYVVLGTPCLRAFQQLQVVATPVENELRNRTGTGALYRVRVTVLNPQQQPINDAKVTSSMGGEPKKVEGGWQFDIPAASQQMANSPFMPPWRMPSGVGRRTCRSAVSTTRTPRYD